MLVLLGHSVQPLKVVLKQLQVSMQLGQSGLQLERSENRDLDILNACV
jgi:hypothetical protein